MVQTKLRLKRRTCKIPLFLTLLIKLDLINMTERNAHQYFKKSTRTSARFFRQIWRLDEKDIDTLKIYRGFGYRKRRPSFINDFVNHCSLISANLSTDEILSIHETNADMNSCSGKESTESDNEYEHSEESNLQKNHSPTTRWHPFSKRNDNDQRTVHLTDEFLDKFHIPTGQKKTRCKTYKMKSEFLFYYLSYQIGTLNLVKRRQKLQSRILANALRFLFSPVHIDVIGSRSEGLDMEGSDTDVLFFDVYARETLFNDDRCTEPCDLNLRYSSYEEGVYPGYVLLRHANNTILPSNLSNYVIQKVLTLPNGFLQTTINGPAKTHANIDFVSSVKSADWPERAHGWKTRKRNFGWPSEEMVTNITRKGCHIVPVGSKRNHSIDTEWRLSFCIAERELIWTFNLPQILIYGLLKIILKEIINPSCHKGDLIFSYVLKTVMFWVIEETSPTIWSPTNMIFLFHKTFNKLLQFIADNECPNYFIPSNNMLIDRINECDRGHLLQALLDIEDSGMAWMYRSKSFRPFAHVLGVEEICSMHAINSIGVKSVQKEKFSLYLTIQELVVVYRQLLSLSHQKNTKHVRNIFKSIKSLTIKRQVLPFFAHFLTLNGLFTGNKEIASFKNFHMDLLVQEAFGCIPVGKNMLALHFYCEGRFNDCLRVLKSMVGNMDFCIRHDSEKTSKHEHMLEVCLSCATNFKDLQHFYTSSIIIPYTSHLLSDELFIFIPFKRTRQFLQKNTNLYNSIVYPETFVHFVRCLCHIKLGRNECFNEAYMSMNNVQYVTQIDKNRVKDMNLWVVCNALKKGINLDYTDEESFQRYVLSDGMELECPHHLPSLMGHLFENITNNNVISKTYRPLDHIPSNVLQVLKETMPQVTNDEMNECLSQFPSTARQMITDLWLKVKNN